MIIFPLFSISVGIAIRQITAQITSVVPFNNITCRHRVLTTAIIWIPAVHTIHPTTPASSIEFIEVINTLNILAAVSSAVFHLELISIPDTAEQIKDCQNRPEDMDVKTGRIQPLAGTMPAHLGSFAMPFATAVSQRIVKVTVFFFTDGVFLSDPLLSFPLLLSSVIGMSTVPSVLSFFGISAAGWSE